jgi:hypothetical protein
MALSIMTTTIHKRIQGSCAAGTTPRNTSPAVQPFAVRIPRPGERDSYSGLCRTQLFTLIKKGRVKSYSLKTPGATRGIRLIDAESLRQAIIEGSATL